MNYRSLIALLLGLAGGALDFASASLFLMADPRFSSWTIGLSIFGGVVVATGILSITSIARRRMETFGGLMLAYGIVMIVIGWLMRSIPMMMGANLSSIGMYFVGIAMVASGLSMSLRPGMGMHDMQSTRGVRPVVFIASLAVVALLGFGLGSIYNQSPVVQSGPTTMTSNGQHSGSSMIEELSLIKFDFTNLTLVKITIMNTGSSPLTITRISFNGTDVTPSNYLSCIANLTNSKNVPLTMPMNGQTECRLSFAVSGVHAGADYPVRIVTAFGVQFVFFVTAGGTTVTM